MQSHVLRIVRGYFFLYLLLGSTGISLAQSTPRPNDQATLKALLSSAWGFESYGGPGNADFVVRTAGYSAQLLPGEIRLDLTPQGSQVTPEIVRIRFGADPASRPQGEEPLPGVVHYYLGNDPSHWRTDVHRFGRVRYSDIHPGVGLIFYGARQIGSRRELEFDFDVSPGRDVAGISMQVEGATIRQSDGNLDLVTPSGNVLVLRKPELYQLQNGGRKDVSGGYVLREKNEIGFSVPAYDRNLPLIIDPALGYSTLIQDLLELTKFPGQFPPGTEPFEFDTVTGIASDSSGNVYLTGLANAPDPSQGFQPGNPPLPNGSLRIGDAYVAKLNPTGSQLLYTAYLGGNSSAITGTSANGIALDASNNAYIVGITNSPSFATTLGVFNRVPACATEIISNQNCNEPFAAKFDNAGHLVFSTYLVSGGSTDTAGPALGTQRIAVDSTGAVYVAGNIFEALLVFPQDPTRPAVAGLTVTPGAFQTTRNSNRSDYVLKLHPDGSTLDYSTYLGGSKQEEIGGIAVDSSGVAYVDGQTASADFPTTAGAFQTSNTGTTAFFSKLSANGASLLYSTFLGAATLTSGANAIALDGSNNAFIAGTTGGPGFPTTAGVFNPNVNGLGIFNFVSEFDTSGNLALSTYIGPAGTVGVAVDASGIYVGGVTTSVNYPAVNSIEPPPVNGEVPMYVTKLNLTGTALVYSTFVGTFVNQMTGMSVDANQNVYLSGAASDVFPTTVGAFQTVAPLIGNPFRPGFVAKLDPTLGAAVPVLAPRVLQFAQVLQQGVSSTPQTVRLSNFGDADLTLTGLSISGANPGDFSQTNNCTATIPAGKNCTITVVFTPTVPSGARSAILIFSFAGLPSQTVSLSGTAGTPSFQITPTPLDFGTFGTLENSIQTFTITNTGTGPLVMSNAALTPPGNFPSTDFSFGPPNLGPSLVLLQPGQSTTFQIWMHIGLDFGNLTAQFRVDDNTPTSPHIFQLTGFGFHSTPDFGMSTLKGLPATITVTAGQTATYNVIVASVPGFGLGGGSISMSCTGVPAGATCNLSRTSLPLPDNNPETVVVTVKTTAGTASLRRINTMWWPVVAVGLLCVIPRKRSRLKVFTMVLLLAWMGSLISCGGGSGSGTGSGQGGTVTPPTPPGTYTLQVTGTFGNVSHSFPLTLVVK
jgi:Cep192 domain 4